MSFPSDAPTFIPKSGFIQYLDNYVSTFNVYPLYHWNVEAASFDGVVAKWRVVATNLFSNEAEEYVAKFLVVATGENSEGFIPKVPGLESFRGEAMHSSQYENGKRFCNKDCLVVGCGNSGMEIAYDLSNSGARTSIVARSPVHVLSKEMVHLGMFLLKFIPCNLVDNIVTMLGKFRYGDLADYGLQRPTNGPFYLKRTTGRSPVIDVGTVDKIKIGDIQVFPSITKFQGDNVEFTNGEIKQLDAIVFATGYKSTARKWLQDGADLFNEDGKPKRGFPDHWKGKNGLYCAGFSRAGLFGISNDAENIAKDIDITLNRNCQVYEC
ncbi:unnamed protein product [Ilex paraguariensis]|uniref:Flavin-containing monooxygenase n=1 Tax=Ilex paraguariensis TaxID=185542 RepID=A0ABC8QNI4_9AQUA